MIKFWIILLALFTLAYRQITATTAHCFFPYIQSYSFNQSNTTWTTPFIGLYVLEVSGFFSNHLYLLQSQIYINSYDDTITYLPYTQTKKLGIGTVYILYDTSMNLSWHWGYYDYTHLTSEIENQLFSGKYNRDEIFFFNYKGDTVEVGSVGIPTCPGTLLFTQYNLGALILLPDNKTYVSTSTADQTHKWYCQLGIDAPDGSKMALVYEGTSNATSLWNVTQGYYTVINHPQIFSTDNVTMIHNDLPVQYTDCTVLTGSITMDTSLGINVINVTWSGGPNYQTFYAPPTIIYTINFTTTGGRIFTLQYRPFKIISFLINGVEQEIVDQYYARHSTEYLLSSEITHVLVDTHIYINSLIPWAHFCFFLNPSNIPHIPLSDIKEVQCFSYKRRRGKK